MQPEFAKRLEAMIGASGGRLGVGSGYRSIEEQTYLWENSDKTGKWVAPPGKSNHNHGVAADLAFNTDDATEWAHANAARFGLFFPMDYEPWHIEPAGQVEHSDPEAYTTPPNGHTHPQDATKRGTLEYQLQSLHSLLLTPDPSILQGPTGGGLGGPETDILGEQQTGASAAAPTPAFQDDEQEVA
jgi:hypothetical protein